MAERYKLQVKWFDTKKGFGFLVGSHQLNHQDVFVHYRSIMDEGFKNLNENEVVECGVVQSEKGYQAVEVYRLNGNMMPVTETEDEYATA